MIAAHFIVAPIQNRQGSEPKKVCLIRRGEANAVYFELKRLYTKKAAQHGYIYIHQLLVPKKGLEPSQPRGYQHLKLARLPIPPLGQVVKKNKGEKWSRKQESNPRHPHYK